MEILSLDKNEIKQKMLFPFFPFMNIGLRKKRMQTQLEMRWNIFWKIIFRRWYSEVFGGTQNFSSKYLFLFAYHMAFLIDWCVSRIGVRMVLIRIRAVCRADRFCDNLFFFEQLNAMGLQK